MVWAGTGPKIIQTAAGARKESGAALMNTLPSRKGVFAIW
jgi:hypothetical protein